MQPPVKFGERRRSARQLVNRIAKIQISSGMLPRDCLVTDISDGGVRLHIEGYEVPDDFVLLLADDGAVMTECRYSVVWRLGFEIGAKKMGVLRNTAPARARVALPG